MRIKKIIKICTIVLLAAVFVFISFIAVILARGKADWDKEYSANKEAVRDYVMETYGNNVELVAEDRETSLFANRALFTRPTDTFIYYDKNNDFYFRIDCGWAEVTDYYVYRREKELSDKIEANFGGEIEFISKFEVEENEFEGVLVLFFEGCRIDYNAIQEILDCIYKECGVGFYGFKLIIADTQYKQNYADALDYSIDSEKLQELPGVSYVLGRWDGEDIDIGEMTPEEFQTFLGK